MNTLKRCLRSLLLVGVIFLLAQATPLPASDAQLARALRERADQRAALCAVLGHDGNLALELARGSDWLVHVRDPRTEAIAEVLTQSREAGLGIQRLTGERGALSKLPYVDNSVDVVISTTVSPSLLRELNAQEVLRVLRPGGRAILGARKGGSTPPVTGDQLTRWVARAKVPGDVVQDEQGTWIQLTKPERKGVDDWSHWEKGPDNNPVSNDQVIKAPYLTQYMAKPYYIGMPAVTTIAGGRSFLAIGHIAHHRREWNMLNKIIARNGYNGRILWERDLPEGYLVHRSAFIATPDIFYMIGGDVCAMLDTRTGKVLGAIRIPGLEGEWKWMAMQDGVLYVLAGKKDPKVETTKGDREFGGWSWADLSKGYYGKTGNYNRTDIPWGFGHTLAAYDLNQKKLLWKHEEEKPIDSRGLAISDGKFFLICPGSHLHGLSLKDGNVLWTSRDAKVIDLIQAPGQRLRSTPGFKTMCFTVATPKVLIIQGQTRMNVVGLSTATGKLLWTKKKVTNNPNAIFVDGKVIIGVGKGGSHVAIDPVTGEEVEDLGFLKRACTRLTASPDSFFCRGEGLMRFDRQSRKMLIDGSARPGCNDGAIPANGLLYLGPWQCDCNLSLIGNIAQCSAEDFTFDYLATEKDNLQRRPRFDVVAPLELTANDWPTYRANNQRSAGSKARLALPLGLRWQSAPKVDHTPTVPVAAGGLVFVAGEDGQVRALRSKDGSLAWRFATGAPIKYPPTIWEGRAYVGDGNGVVHCLEAATGRLLWRFRAAPLERSMMVYGHLCSTWPVNSGVLVQDGTAYFAAGIVDHDGTYVYAVDAKTGKIRWQNNSSGHLEPPLRKGVSVQGNLTVQGERLLLAAGNQVSPAPFDLKTGKCLAQPITQGQPKTNGGRFVGVLPGDFPILGGRILYSSSRNVATKGSFEVSGEKGKYTLTYGGIPPAWDEKNVVLVNFKHGKVTCCDASKVSARISKGYPELRAGQRRFRMNLASALQTDGAIRWQSDLNEPNRFEALSLAVCPNAVVAVVQYQQRTRSQPTWFLVALDPSDGRPLARQLLLGEPLPGGLLVNREGKAIVTMLDGRVFCFGG